MLSAIAWPKSIENETPAAAAARVHAWALSIFVWTADIETWQVPELWPLRSELEGLAERNGGAIHEDCDGFAILCRCALWDLGVENRLLVVNVEPTAAAPSPTGNHAVAIVDGTDLVLDCRQQRVVSRDELERVGYEWIAMSGLRSGDPWTEVKT